MLAFKKSLKILHWLIIRFIKSIEERNLTTSANIILKQNVYKSAGKPEGRASNNHFYGDSVNSDKDFPIAKDKFLKSREVSTHREQWLIKGIHISLLSLAILYLLISQ